VIGVDAERDPLPELRRQLLEIQARNDRVEREKAWETSFTRRLVIAGATWMAAWLWLRGMPVEHAARQALVPTLAYFVSTFSLPFLRRWWISRFRR
jgi:hypothetical protein